MILKRLLNRDEKGIGAVEFALVAPVLIAFIVGISQLGRMFYANADMKNATAHAARVASVYREPTPVDDATIIAAVKDRLLRDGALSKVTVTIVRGTDGGNPWVEIKTDYSVPLEFIFFSTPPVTLHDTRKVYTQVVSPNLTTTTTSASTSTTSSTSASSSSTSSGDASSSTSASSTSSGDASSSTSSTSSGDASTSSTSSGDTGTSSSSGSNASSGSNNGSNGNGHAHGKCNGCK